MSSRNLTKLKKLLAAGWRIAGETFSINAAKRETKIGLILERVGKKQYMKVVNDEEFIEYILHFQKFQDKYGNNEFIFVDDLDAYNKRLEEIRRKGVVPKRPYKVFIGDVELNGVHLYHLVLPGPGGAHIGAAHFFVDLAKNPDFCQMDLRSEVKVIWTDNNNTAFGGFVHEAAYGRNSAVFLCYGGSRRLHQGRITCEYLGMRAEDILYFVTVYSGVKAKFHGNLQPNLTKRDFTVVFPIVGLMIPNDFEIHDVLFTSDLGKELSQQAKKAKTLSKRPWSTASAFAVLTLKARHYYEALVRAKEIAENAVDWLQLRTDITFPCFIEGKAVRRIYYNLSKNFSRCQLVRYGLVIEASNGASAFCLLDISAGHPLVFKGNPGEFLAPLVPIWTKLRLLHDEEQTRVRALNQTLNWLMLSFETESPIDNLLQLWIALEFLCSKERIPKRVQKQNLKNCMAAIKGLSISQKEKEAVLESIGFVNNPLLMARWKHLVDRLGVKLTKQEMMLILKLRTERNRITHGKEVSRLTIEEVEKFRSILERVFLLETVQLIERRWGIPFLGNIFA